MQLISTDDTAYYDSAESAPIPVPDEATVEEPAEEAGEATSGDQGGEGQPAPGEGGNG